MKITHSMICREAHIGDHSTLLKYQLALALETESLTLDRNTCEKGVRAIFERPHLGKYYIAEIDGKSVGCLLIIPEWSDWRNGLVWWIHSVFIEPSARKSGVFTAMYRFIRTQGENEDIRGIRLYVDKTNLAAQAVYQRLGMSNHHYELYESMNS